MAYKRRDYQRKNRCSYCGGVGHNRATCPALKAVIQERLAANPDDIPANTLLAHEEAKKARRANTKRKCSFCGEEGHNRSTCGELKKEVEVIAKLNIAYRKRILAVMERLQISEFMLATSGRVVNEKCEEAYPIPLVLHSIHWENINYWSRQIRWPERHQVVFEFRTLPLIESEYGNYSRHSKFSFTTFSDEEMIELTCGQILEESSRHRSWLRHKSWPTVSSPTGRKPQPPAQWLELKSVKKEVKKYITTVGLTIDNFHDASYMRLTLHEEDLLGIKDPLKSSNS